MSLFAVDVSGEVSAQRHRSMHLYANSEEEAKEKAKESFKKAQEGVGCLVFDETVKVDNIVKLSKR